MADKEYIERGLALFELETGWFPQSMEYTEAVAIARGIIKSSPAADVVEVRYGHWEEQLDGTHYCSECGHDATYTYDGTEVCGIACPFCGAKMDGKGEGE